LHKLSQEEIDYIYKKIGENVKKIRKEKGISQLELAHLIGHKSVSIVSCAEIYHKKQHFNIIHLIQIAKALNVDICDFFEGISSKV
jgi:transcriptional regulator with XRE-family HTH domain